MKNNSLGIRVFVSTVAASTLAALLALTGGCVGPNPEYAGWVIVDGAPTNADGGTNPDVDGGNTSPDLGTPCPKALEAAFGTTTGFEHAKCALVAGPKDGSSAVAATPDLVWYPKGTNTQLVYQPGDPGVAQVWTMRDTAGNAPSGYPRIQMTNTWVAVPGVAATVYSPLTGNGGMPAGFCSFLLKGVVSQRCEKVQTFTLWTP